MNFGNMQGFFWFVPFAWGAFWSFLWLWVALRFLRAFERGVRAHEQLANAAFRVPMGQAPAQAPDRTF